MWLGRQRKAPVYNRRCTRYLNPVNSIVSLEITQSCLMGLQGSSIDGRWTCTIFAARDQVVVFGILLPAIMKELWQKTLVSDDASSHMPLSIQSYFVSIGILPEMFSWTFRDTNSFNLEIYNERAWRRPARIHDKIDLFHFWMFIEQSNTVMTVRLL